MTGPAKDGVDRVKRVHQRCQPDLNQELVEVESKGQPREREREMPEEDVENDGRVVYAN